MPTEPKLGFWMSRPERRRYKKRTGIDPKTLQQVSDRGIEALADRKCGWCGQLICNPQFHPPPDYGCTKAPLMSAAGFGKTVS